MKKTIIVLIITSLLITTVIAIDSIDNQIKETDKYSTYNVKEEVKGIDKDAIKFEVKTGEEVNAVQLITDFIEMKKEIKGYEIKKVNSD